MSGRKFFFRHGPELHYNYTVYLYFLTLLSEMQAFTIKTIIVVRRRRRRHKSCWLLFSRKRFKQRTEM